MEIRDLTPAASTQREPALVWRWAMLVVTVTIVLALGPWQRAAPLVLLMLTGMLSVHMLPRDVLERWLDRGHLIISDGLLICLALMGTDRVPSSVFVGLFSVILVATVVSDRRKTLVASGAVLALMAGAAQGAMSDAAIALAAALYVPLLVAAALSFGTLAEQMSGQRKAAAQARQETSELWALLDITDAVGSTLDVGQVMRSVVTRVGEMVQTDSCSILLANPQLETCSVVASRGHPDVQMLELDLTKYPEVRRALETREPVIVDDVESDPIVESVREILLEKGYRSLLVLPLVFGKEVLGTLFLRARRDQPFSADELRFCKVAAGASANALKNALLYEESAAEAERHRVTGEKLRRVLNGTPDLIVATDIEGKIVEFNRGAEELTGWSENRARGRSLDDVLGRDLQVWLSEHDRSGNVARDVMLRRTDGERVEISLVHAPLQGPGGENVGRVWIGRDVSKLRQVEKSLIQAERLSSVGEVVAGVAHELNNPLSGVMGYAELLRPQVDDPDQSRDLQRIVESAARCQKIVLNLLSFARKHPPEKKYQDLNDCMKKVLDLKSYHLRSSQIDTVLELQPELPSTCFDVHQVEQVVLNLLNNAEQAIVTLKSPGKIVLRTGVQDDFVYFEVEDNGPGIPASIRERIFDPFFTTKGIGHGTGLGLSVSYGIISEHGGRIDAHSDADAGGTRFRVLLPLVEGQPEETGLPEPGIDRNASPLRDLRILVAEDEPLVLELFARVLGEEGAVVTLARDGQEAWEHLQESEFDLIVADLRMPNVSGQQLYERLAEDRPEMLRRFVFATGDLGRQESLAFLRGLPNRVLTKPLQIDTVKRVLSQAVTPVVS